jgi:hypothetical protein
MTLLGREGFVCNTGLEAVLGKTHRTVLGRAMETSASFEARYAPSLYPTNQVVLRRYGSYEERSIPASISARQLILALDEQARIGAPFQ